MTQVQTPIPMKFRKTIMADSGNEKADPHVGKLVDGCILDRKLGQGGMGIAYLATHTELQRHFVIKLLNPSLASSEDTIQRFYREAQSVAKLNHQNIVAIQNVGHDNDFYFIRMEYVDGVTLESIVRARKKLDWRKASEIIYQTVEALSHAHEKGIIHRDIKPENIMYCEDVNIVKVMDFGLAKHVQSAKKVSITGQIVGTPFFMSPEQAGGKETDERSDIYSLGVTYYYLLSGVKPFNGKNLQEIFLKHFFYTPESPKIYTPELPQEVCDLIRQCLKKKKAERYQSAAAIGRDLERILQSTQAMTSPAEQQAAEYLQLRQPSAEESRDAFDAMMEAQSEVGDNTRVTKAGEINYLDLRGKASSESEMDKTAVRGESSLQGRKGDSSEAQSEPSGTQISKAAATAEVSKAIVGDYQVDEAEIGDQTRITKAPSESVAKVAEAVVGEVTDDFDGGQTAVRNTSTLSAPDYPADFEDEASETIVANAASFTTDSGIAPIVEEEYEPATIVSQVSALGFAANYEDVELRDPAAMAADSSPSQDDASAVIDGTGLDGDTVNKSPGSSHVGSDTIVRKAFAETGTEPSDMYDGVYREDNISPEELAFLGGVSEPSMAETGDTVARLPGQTSVQSAAKSSAPTLPAKPLEDGTGSFSDNSTPEESAVTGQTSAYAGLADGDSSVSEDLDYESFDTGSIDGESADYESADYESADYKSNDDESAAYGSADYESAVAESSVERDSGDEVSSTDTSSADFIDFVPAPESEEKKVGVESVSFRSASDFFMDRKGKHGKEAAEGKEETAGEKGTKVLARRFDNLPIPPGVIAIFGLLIILGVSFFIYLKVATAAQMDAFKDKFEIASSEARRLKDEAPLTRFITLCNQMMGSAPITLDVGQVEALKRAAKKEQDRIIQKRLRIENPTEVTKPKVETIAEKKARKRREAAIKAAKNLKIKRDREYINEWIANKKLLKAKKYRLATKKMILLANRIRKEWPAHEVLKKIRVPVTISSFPLGARVYLNKSTKIEGETPLTLMLKLNESFIVRIEEDSFNTVTEEIVSDKYNAVDAELSRTMIDRASLGKGQVPLSVKSRLASKSIRSKRTTPVVEVTPIIGLNGDKKSVFVVSREGLLRAIKFEGIEKTAKASLVWQTAALIGRYGDKTRNPAITKQALFCAGAGVSEKTPDGKSNQFFTVCAIDPDDGTKLWKYDTKSPCTAHPLAASIGESGEKTKVLVVATLDGRVMLLDQQSGEPLLDDKQRVRSYQLEGSACGRPAVDGNIVYVLCEDNRLHAIDWQPSQPKLHCFVDLGGDPSVGLIRFGNWLFVGTVSGQLHTLEIQKDKTLKRVWSFDSEGLPIKETIVIAEDRVYFSNGKKLFSLFLKNGKAVPNWAPEVQSPVTAPSYGTEGIVYIGCGDAILLALDSLNGAYQWSHQLRDKDNQPVDLTAGPFVMEDKVNGKMVSKVAVISRRGLLYTFKR
jgi:serine/threonine protein kinase/outer membrane protein assembly factor BamB